MPDGIPASLVLENGATFFGQGFGARTDVIFELVFNTSMTGYQEILSDPSYHGQGVLFTTSHIGNVGINQEDHEAQHPHVSAVVTRSVSPVFSNWRATQDLPSWLREFGIPGITGVDTRAITRQLRDVGTMRAALSTQGTPANDLHRLTREWTGLDGRDMVQDVTCKQPYLWQVGPGDLHWVPEISTPGRTDKVKVVLVDYGAKRHILRHLAARHADVWVVPASTTAEQILAMRPDGVMLSNGPGDPAGLPYAVETVSRLIGYGLPVFGICLGHQLIGLALGGKTSRLKFGHHGGNHPVKNIQTGKVYITAQNHNYTVLPDSIKQDDVEITHISLNDGSVEGLSLKKKPVYSVQFHPEAAPGPHDAHEIFQPFFETMWNYKLSTKDGNNG
jgi:carbamoyl-phosphate synthase small subunit